MGVTLAVSKQMGVYQSFERFERYVSNIELLMLDELGARISLCYQDREACCFLGW